MTVSIVIDHESEQIHAPVRPRAVFPVEKRMLLQAAMPLPIRGVKVNDLSPLWPAGHLRAAVLAAARAWVAQMQERGYELNQHEGDILLFGPYKPKSWNRAGGRNGMIGAAGDGDGYESESCDMLLYAWFLAPRGKIYAEDHERMSQTFGKEYDQALAASGNNVAAAMAALPEAGVSESARVAVEMVDERERREDPKFGLE